MTSLKDWKPEHRTALFVSTLGGAAAGLAIGYLQRSHDTWGFTVWLTYSSVDAVLWTAIGAIVVGAAVYTWRSFST